MIWTLRSFLMCQKSSEVIIRLRSQTFFINFKLLDTQTSHTTPIYNVFPFTFISIPLSFYVSLCSYIPPLFLSQSVHTSSSLPACRWGLEYADCTLCKMVIPPPNMGHSGLEIKLHLIVMLQSRNFRECGVLIYWHYFRVHSNLKK